MDVNPFRRRNSDDWQPEEERYFESKKNRLKHIWGSLMTFWLKNWRIWAGLLIVLAIGWKLFIWAGLVPSSTFPLVDKNKWQSVFLTNGQVYFGHLKEQNRDYAILKNTYYLRMAEQPSSQQQQQINLVKLGSELHGPEDIMYIPKEQIVFWENLKSDSLVVRSINQLEGAQ